MADQVEVLTDLLRSSADPFWLAMRQALVARELDVAACVLAVSCEQGDDSEFGVLVTAERTVVQFAWQRSSGTLTDWVPITQWWADSPYRAEIAVAMNALEQTG